MFSQPFFIPSALIALLSLPLIFGWILPVILRRAVRRRRFPVTIFGIQRIGSRV